MSAPYIWRGQFEQCPKNLKQEPCLSLESFIVVVQHITKLTVQIILHIWGWGGGGVTLLSIILKEHIKAMSTQSQSFPYPLF